ncbi:hypothetical protein N7530_000348 [Penicillium desertorum]|uniref:Uncharacterized protein n=1 Tax=Penicillium desertorum TaxID=1303715 RepID=A0A9W9X7S0_9EURO|nr:hypothetical protein N7530_000348 [Penicillium desertorum]
MADGRETMAEALSPRNATAADGVCDDCLVAHTVSPSETALSPHVAELGWVIAPICQYLSGREWSDERCCGVVEKENNAFLNGSCMNCHTRSGLCYVSVTSFLFFMFAILR